MPLGPNLLERLARARADLRLGLPVALVFTNGAALDPALTWLGLLYLPWGPGASGLLLYGALGFAAGGFVVGYAAAKEVLPPAVSGMAIALVNTGLFLGAAVLQPSFGMLGTALQRALGRGNASTGSGPTRRSGWRFTPARCRWSTRSRPRCGRTAPTACSTRTVE